MIQLAEVRAFKGTLQFRIVPKITDSRIFGTKKDV